jgi:hypothetical protein
MSVLSVDLSIRSWSDLGVVLLEQKGALIACEIFPWPEPHTPPVVELAQRLNAVCEQRRAGVLMLDGPQAWRSSEPAVPGLTHSTTYDRFVSYCLALYDALGRLGWRRLAALQGQDAPTSKILVESYPDTSWRTMGIPVLPARANCRVSHLAEAYAALTMQVPITTSQPPNYGQLQAIVGGLQGLAIENCRVIGAFAGPRQNSRTSGQVSQANGNSGEGWIESLLPQAADSDAPASWLQR